MTISLAGQLICETEQEAERVRLHLAEHLRLTRAEAGCLHFSITPTVNPLIWEVREIFRDRAAFNAHQARTAGSFWARATVGIRRDYRIMGG